jgi:hypothetical protein
MVLKGNFCSLSGAAPSCSENTDYFSNLQQIVINERMKSCYVCVGSSQSASVAQDDVEQGGISHCKDYHLHVHIECHLRANNIALKTEQSLYTKGFQNFPPKAMSIHKTIQH